MRISILLALFIASLAHAQTGPIIDRRKSDLYEYRTPPFQIIQDADFGEAVLEPNGNIWSRYPVHHGKAFSAKTKNIENGHVGQRPRIGEDAPARSACLNLHGDLPSHEDFVNL